MVKKFRDKALGRFWGFFSSAFPVTPREGGVAIPKIFFCHVPKCAGSSIVSAVWNQVYSGYSVAKFEIEQEPSKKSARVLDTSMMRARETILAYNLSMNRNYFGRGHCYCRPKLVREFGAEWDFVTILRNPVDRWISEYIYNTFKASSWARNDLQLSEYLESKKGYATGRYLIRYFSNYSNDHRTNPYDYVDEALENLSHFSVVGTLESLDIWEARMNQRYGVTLDIPKMNVSPRSQEAEKIKSNAKLMEKIQELCKYDMEIYRKYLELAGKSESSTVE